MNFRSLEKFNGALLAKKCWRILTDGNSLIAKVFKGKYFNYSSFQVAKLGCNPSHVWRSLLWGRDVLKRGLIWRVRYGADIHVYKDN